MLNICTVVLNYNNAPDTIECLESIGKCTEKSDLIVLVDNNSSDNSILQIKTYLESSELPILFSTNFENRGFGAGCNVGIKLGLEKKCNYFLLINNDAVVDSKIYSNLRSILASDQKHILGGKVLNYLTGKPSESIGNISSHNMFVSPPEKSMMDVPHHVDFASGCVMGIPLEVIAKNGYIFEDFFLYYEDVEYCLRAARRGIRSFYYPNLVVYHKVSSTVKKEKVNSGFYGLRNHTWIVKKYGNFHQLITYLRHHFSHIFNNLLPLKPNFLILKAIFCGIFGFLGKIK